MTGNVFDEMAMESGPYCFWCRAPLVASTASRDHVIPAAFGGGSGPGNVVLSCLECNNLRSRVTTLARQFCKDRRRWHWWELEDRRDGLLGVLARLEQVTLLRLSGPRREWCLAEIHFVRDFDVRGGNAARDFPGFGRIGAVPAVV